jgi:predicted alpha/beta superfamily hydrolase
VHDSLLYRFNTDTVYSDTLHQNRIVKVYLPKDFKSEGKYPVFYVLDASWMFEPAVTEIKQLASFNIIPPSIVIGVQSSNRGNDLRISSRDGLLTETSRKFEYFLTKELPGYITANYTKPVFNILIGHSDGATFAHKILTEENQPFRAVIALSQNLFSNQLQEYIDFSKKTLPNNIYYFVSSGTRDASGRIRSGLKLDSIFARTINDKLKARHVMYDADHAGVAIRGLSEGISFVFSDYYEDNDWNDKLIDSLVKIEADPVEVINANFIRIKNIYGIEVKPTQDEGVMTLASAICRTRKQLERFMQYESEHFEKNDDYYSIMAQRYERINDFEKALEYWKLNLAGNYPHNQGFFFYYSRPIDLLVYKMDLPKDAIEFAEEWEKKQPGLVLQFNYTIAKICSEKNIEKKKGLAAIQFCLAHFEVNRLFNLEDAKAISDKLKKQAL